MKMRDNGGGKKRLLSIFFLLLAGFAVDLAADDTTWPKVVRNDKGELTIYQPQPESLDGTLLSARAAISVKANGVERPVFGAIWITTTLVVDRDTRIATMTNSQVPNIRFSDEVDSVALQKLRIFIEQEIEKWDLELSVDNLVATMESASVTNIDQFKNDPPEIIVANNPSILVFIDGEPRLADMEGYDFKRIENSPYLVIQDPQTKTWYFYGDRLWYSATDYKGPWEQMKKPTKSLSKLQDDIDTAEAENGEAPGSKKGEVHDIIVRTTPAELIVINGKPDFAPVKGTTLLYVKNSDNIVFMDIESQNYFILVSGRWYSSSSMEGSWSFINADSLPAEFAKIPEGSDHDAVLASVPGTNAAKEAILDSQIPQTAAVDRKSATVDVEYDGEPKFEKVDGTSMQYAVNSPQTVLKLSNKYYCVDNGVWFEATNPKGPWQVSVERPEEVEEIEPSSPVYNVKYVYIYDVTPTVVYVGYTPGYYGSYVYGPTVIYGTGYYYRPWYGAYYYPRPVTYGFGMSYNPWTGWSMSWGISYGFMHLSFHSGYRGGYYGGYWGPPAYRPPYHRHPPGGYYGRGVPTRYASANNGRNSNIYDNNRSGVRPSTRPATRPATSPTTRPANTPAARPATRPATGTGSQAPARMDNNVYTDRNGNVYQKTDNGWQSRENNGWKDVGTTPSRGNQPATGAVRPATGNTGNSAGNNARPATRPTSPSTFDNNSMNRASQSRDRGQVRTSNYNSYSRNAGTTRPTQSRSVGRASGRR